MALLPSGNYFAGLFADNPAMKALQYSMTALAVVHVFVVFLITRDILKRTNSIVYQIACILTAAAMPVVGIFAYLLVRPSRTLSDRNMEKTLEEILKNLPTLDTPESDIVEKSKYEHKKVEKENLTDKIEAEEKEEISMEK